ncbi:hypothetical protein [Corynebacterium phoceense]|uniref:hypothetical protein n=2 Tax=Corynebacteriaceae TaxID=1653 RepID=UPI0012B637F8|nr:hypothetical protein [Corynebacterium phoceense]
MGQRLANDFVNDVNNTFDLKDDPKNELNAEFLQELEEQENTIIEGRSHGLS